MAERPILMIVIASTRPGRIGLPVGEWIEARALGHGGFDVDLADLKEWRYKPVGLVSYGGVSAGTRAAQMIKQVVTTLKLFPIFEAVSIPFVAQFLDEEGRLTPNDVMEKAADAMLDELLRVSEALAPLRG